MPESVRGLILRKLDQLAEEDRRLLAAGSVQGAEFESAVVARALGEDPATTEERLQDLEQVHGLIRLLREHEFADRTVSRRYAFVHALYQDALYSGQPPARRAGLSRMLADALMDLQRGQPGAAAAELALLYESGRDFGRAADLFHAAALNAARAVRPPRGGGPGPPRAGTAPADARRPRAGRPGVAAPDRPRVAAAGDRRLRGGRGGGGVRPGPGAVGQGAGRGPALPDPVGPVAVLQGAVRPRPGPPAGRGAAGPRRAVRGPGPDSPGAAGGVRGRPVLPATRRPRGGTWRRRPPCTTPPGTGC